MAQSSVTGSAANEPVRSDLLVPMTGDRTIKPEDRARYRRFVKENHPDAGGDPAVFVAGLAALRGSARVPDRYDAPVMIVSKHYRTRLLAGRLWRRLRGSRATRVH